MVDEQPNRRAADESEDAKILDKILGFERATHNNVNQMGNKINLIENNQNHMADKLELLVSKLEFAPVKMLVYGTTGIILTAVIGALVALVVSK